MTKGFTLLEIMVVVIIIGIMAAIGLPRFLRSPIPVTQKFITQLNLLVTDAVEQAVEKNEARRIFFDVSAKRVEIQTIEGRASGGKIVFPDQVSVVDVVINGVSQFQSGSASKRTVYFLINKDGISQQVNLLLQEQLRSGKSRTFEFYLHPFTNLFRVL